VNTVVLLGFTLPKGEDGRIFDLPPMAIYVTNPDYTNEARDAKVHGNVELQVSVATDGTVSDVEITKSLGKGLDERAVEQVKAWQFLPALKAGKPVPSKIPATISFSVF
jgi:periplasmic protein TonB